MRYRSWLNSQCFRKGQLSNLEVWKESSSKKGLPYLDGYAHVGNGERSLTFVHLFCPQDIHKHKFNIFIQKMTRYTQHIHTAYVIHRAHTLWWDIQNLHQNTLCVHAVCTLCACCVYAACMLCVRCVYLVIFLQPTHSAVYTHSVHTVHTFWWDIQNLHQNTLCVHAVCMLCVRCV